MLDVLDWNISVFVSHLDNGIGARELFLYFE